MQPLAAPCRSQTRVQGKAGVKRWIKKNVYMQLPIGMRALVYFVYRYFCRFGFLDWPEGTAFHVLQAFWYRYLIDIKLYEVKSAIKYENIDVVSAIQKVLGISFHGK